MAKVRITITLDEDVLRAVKACGARTGREDSEVIEAVLRRGLGFELLEREPQRGDPDEEQATALAVEAQHETRHPR